MTDYNHWNVAPGQLKDGETCPYATETIEQAKDYILKFAPPNVTFEIRPIKVIYDDGVEGIRYGII